MFVECSHVHVAIISSSLLSIFLLTASLPGFCLSVKSAMNTWYITFDGYTHLFILRLYLWMELLGHRVWIRLAPVYIEFCQLVEAIHISPVIYERSSCSTSVSTLMNVSLFSFCPFRWSLEVLRCSFNLCVCSVVQSCLTLCNPWTVAHQAPLCMRFFRQEYWSGLPFPPVGDLPYPGIESTSPAL